MSKWVEILIAAALILLGALFLFVVLLPRSHKAFADHGKPLATAFCNKTVANITYSVHLAKFRNVEIDALRSEIRTIAAYYEGRVGKTLFDLDLYFRLADNVYEGKPYKEEYDLLVDKCVIIKPSHPQPQIRTPESPESSDEDPTLTE